MALFKRKPAADDDTPRCPECRERIPDGAATCAMCGRDLADVHAAAQRGRQGDAAGAR